MKEINIETHRKVCVAICQWVDANPDKRPQGLVVVMVMEAKLVENF